MQYGLQLFWPKAFFTVGEGQRPRNDKTTIDVLAEGHSHPYPDATPQEGKERYDMDYDEEYVWD